MTVEHTNSRLEALCDGVFAIALTLLILDVKLPSADDITSTSEFWNALRSLGPSVFAFVLSFGVILITWVNHHATLRLIHGSTASFIYANGFLLLTVVFVPFPTELLGSFLWTDHAAPAVALYDAVLAAQGVGWILISGVALRNRLTTDEASTATLRNGNKQGYMALILYSLLAVIALWFPVSVAAVTTASWIFWLSLGVRMKHA
jgi:TMEM175 potassium channel family protein